MSRGNPTDYFSLAGTGLKINSSDEGVTINMAEAVDERGDFVARETYEELANPSCTYALCDDYALGAIKLGSKISDYIVTGLSVNTSAGGAPTVEVSGEEVPATFLEGYTYTTPVFQLKKNHEAQILFSAFTLGGEGCYIESCSASLSCTLSRALDENAETCAGDVSAGAIEVTATIIQSAEIEPTVTPGVDWTVSSPLTLTESNDAYESYTVTLRSSLSAVAPAVE